MGLGQSLKGQLGALYKTSDLLQTQSSNLFSFRSCEKSSQIGVISQKVEVFVGAIVESLIDKEFHSTLSLPLPRGNHLWFRPLGVFDTTGTLEYFYQTIDFLEDMLMSSSF